MFFERVDKEKKNFVVFSFFSAPLQREKKAPSFPSLSFPTLALLFFSLLFTEISKSPEHLAIRKKSKKQRPHTKGEKRARPTTINQSIAPCRPEDRQPDAEANTERRPVVRRDVAENQAEVVPVDERGRR